MAEGSARSKIAVVTGDLTIDWNMALFSAEDNEGLRGGSWRNTGVRAYQQHGGAALVADLVSRVAESLGVQGEGDWEVRSVDLQPKSILPADARYHHAHALWSCFDDDQPTWRVSEFLGLSRGPLQSCGWQKVKDDPPDADLVILDDADLGFRESRKLWPKAVLDTDCPAWILLKMARPVAQGALWDHLHTNCSERLIVIMPVDDLRRTEVQISRELSWERTAHDLYWELTYNPRINALSRCAHVVVSFNTAGAFLLSGSCGDDPPEATLFYDPAIVEGMWSQSFPGGMIGYTTCLTAGIARQVMLNNARPDLHQGIQSGLSAMRLLHQQGYTEPDEAGPGGGLRFPAELIGEELCESRKAFYHASVPSPVGRAKDPDGEKRVQQDGGWAIFQDLFSDAPGQVARNIVLQGVEVSLEGVPLGHFGKLIAADRREVESFRSIRRLIGEYCGQSLTKPFSIAVFGPPGSGKSFAVKQISASARPGEIEPLEFNLSQFGSVDDLYDAFHQIRDVALSGTLPLVFWDEFDSVFENRPLGWLRYFLAPMQDGEFLEGQITHPIGRCIFVFAGGTCYRMEEFTSSSNREEFVRMKGPDFVSRLKGYLNILGPNPYTTEQEPADPYYLVRRAIILRVMLANNAPQILEKYGGGSRLNIDRGVLRALLHIGEYKHGVRSIESIIAMSNLTGKTSFERSSLPSETQLNLHVDGREFIALVRQLELEGEVLEELARLNHLFYCANMRRAGYRRGPRDSARKTHPLLVPYAKLDERYKESNRVAVRNIPAKLAAGGYVMVPAGGNETPFEFPADDLQKLARLEHDLWVKSKREQGFTPGKPTRDNPMRNEHMVGWDELPDEIKQIDYDLVKGIPRMLSKAGYAVVKIDEGETPG